VDGFSWEGKGKGGGASRVCGLGGAVWLIGEDLEGFEEAGRRGCVCV
jgi:hypothetical protein